MLATSVPRKARTQKPPPPSGRRGRSVGRYERMAYERQERDLALAYPDGMPADPRDTQHHKGFWFDPVAAERVVTFVEGYCRHFEGEWAGQSLTLEEWQRFVFRCVFGWKRSDGTRRFRIAYQEVGRKNGKSTEAAGVANYLTFGDREPGAQVYSTATKEDQAKIVWGAARSMVKQSPDLRRVATLRQKAIVCDRLGSFYKPLGSDSDTLDGLNPHGHVCDELHAHKDRKMWDVMITAMGARRQPLTFVITTAGLYEPESIGWQQHDHAVKVLDGVVEDDEFFAIVFAADAGDPWDEQSTWEKANPNLGVSVKPEYMESMCAMAVKQPSFLNTFLRLHLNVWTQQRDRWIDVAKWHACDEECSREAMMTREEGLKGAACFGGLDLSTKLDITALVLVFPETWDLVCRFFVPADNVAERVRRDRVPYDAWIRDGWLIATPGDVIDYTWIRQTVVGLAQQFNIRELAYDPWSATETATALQSDGFTMAEVRQGYRTLSEPSQKFEELTTSGKWRHGGHPVMRWMVSNVSTREDPNGSIAPQKPKRNTGLRIDGVSATITALSRVIVSGDFTSTYDSNPLAVL